MISPSLVVLGTSSDPLERLSKESALEHYRFCRSLLIREPPSESGLIEASRYPFAKEFQPSAAALALLARKLRRPETPLIPKLFPSGAPLEGMPFPIAWQLAALWNELGKERQDEELLSSAQRLFEWVKKFGSRASLLYYPEPLFSSSEVNLYSSPGDPIAIDRYRGLAALSSSFLEACITYSGYQTGWGTMRLGSVQVSAFGPQVSSEPALFGLSQLSLSDALFSVIDGRIDSEGWTRIYGNKQIWAHLKASLSSEVVQLDLRFIGIEPGSDRIFVAFYIQANSCEVEGKIFHPGSLLRYKGGGQNFLFNGSVQLRSVEQMESHVIPLAGEGCFWNASFLLLFEFNSFSSRASYSIQFV